MATNETRSVNVDQFRQVAGQIREQLARVMVGQGPLLHDLLVTLLAGGNALLEGVPGLGKTMLVRTLSEVVNCTFNRIQFTPDLMPADITGSMVIASQGGERTFRFEKGPVFANLVLADEINRAAPRTQSALLEAMQEGSVTVAGETYDLPKPFFVLATQNPIEMEGTYPLPEAQIDRFLYKLYVPYPSEDELVEIAKRTTGPSLPQVEQAANSSVLLSMHHLARKFPLADDVYLYIARIVESTHPDKDDALDSVKRHLRVGASPRGLQALVLGGKVEALLNNRKAVAIDDVKKITYPALRHRLILNFEAQADNIDPDEVLTDILGKVKVK